MGTASKNNPTKLALQLLTNFLLPVFILTKLSSTSALGPIKALVLALTFPILYEVYNIIKNKKVSMTSIVVIVGLLITGTLGLLHVSSFWLAIRRAVPYLFVVCVILGSHFTKRSVVMTFLNQILDFKKITKAAKSKNTSDKVKALYAFVTYVIAALFLLITVTSYLITRSVVTSPAQSAQYNQELGTLRIYSLVAVTAPLLMGSVALLFFLFLKLEKLTGLETEELTKIS